jgi:hypothetical protein
MTSSIGAFPDSWKLQEAIDQAILANDSVTQKCLESLLARSNAWGNGYGTHVPALAATVAVARSGLVLELGAGYFSTPLLRAMCAAMGRELVTLDTDREWAEKIGGVQVIDDWSAIDALPADLEIAVVFVDGSSHRLECIRAVGLIAEFVVVHDSFNEGYIPGMEELLNSFPYRTDYTDLVPATSVVSHVRAVKR